MEETKEIEKIKERLEKIEELLIYLAESMENGSIVDVKKTVILYLKENL